MDVVVAGSHGFIGSALVDDLVGRGHTVRRLVRPGSAARRRPPSTPPEPAGSVVDHTWDPRAGVLEPAALEGADAVVNLAGAGIGDRRWTSAYKREILRSRVSTSGLLARTLATLHPDGGPDAPVLVQPTGTGAYGDRGDEVLTETSSRGTDFLAEVVRAWEEATEPAVAAGIPVAHLRSGIVLAPHGGALGRLLPLVRLGLGGPLGPGSQWWPWITLTDELAAIRFAVERPLAGPVNVVAPGLATNAEVTRALARALHRPAVLAVPGFALRIGLGEFGEDLLRSQRAEPTVLRDAGFTWTCPTLEEAARWVAAG